MEVKSFSDINSKAAGDFINFTDMIYREDKRYIPPLKKAVLAHLDKNKNPFFKYGAARYFLAMSGAKVLGRIAAFRNPKMDHDDLVIGSLGYFESINDPSVSNSLISTAIEWLKTMDCNEVIGPMNSSIWNQYRFKIDHYDEDPYIGEPYNPPYYPLLFEQSGFELKHLWYSNLIDLNDNNDYLKEASETYKKHYYRSKNQGYLFSYNNTALFDSEFENIYNFFIDAFDEFDGYYKISFEEFTFLFYGLKRIIKANQLVYIKKDGKTKGIMIQYDDLSKSFRSLGGQSNLITKINYFLNRKSNRVILALAGLTKDEINRPSSLAPAMGHLSFENARNRNMNKIIHMLMSEDNKSNRFSRNISRRIGKYALYRLNI